MQNNDINELRKHYAGLSFAQKKEFIVNLKNKLDSINSPPHKKLLEECVRLYNEEVRKRNAAAGYAPKPEAKMPEVSADTFAIALSSLIGGGLFIGVGAAAIKAKLLGKWQCDERNFYYVFNEDGSFETNEFDGDGDNGILHGDFTISPDNVVLIEPCEQLRFDNLMFSQSGDSLIIRLKDGLTFEYKQQKN
ncbi:MAG: hypothetical protein FWB80_02410 [Defluviitaleaceae bacterium]|nr:hypothetical protein [Defluviitaleaceae bacterium]